MGYWLPVLKEERTQRCTLFLFKYLHLAFIEKLDPTDLEVGQ